MDNLQDIYISEADFRRRYEYTSGDLLGEGGFAQVYKAYDRQFHEYVALKFYNKGEKGKYDVLHEMKDSRSFAHKNIIRVHDAFVVRCEQAGTFSFIQVGVLEYANGGNLRDFIKTKPPENIFIEVLSGILEGLRYLHQEKSIIHRDLSPENILMCIEGDRWTPKISDFGISKKIEIGSLSGKDKKSTQLLGKTEYMAPEQFYPEKFGIDKSINTNVDLWAFGIILYELFMHRTPYGDKMDDNPLSGIHSIISDPVRDIDEIPDPYRKVIEKCLLKEASKRIQKPEEIISILQGSHTKSLKPGKTRPVTELAGKKVNLRFAFISIVSVIVLLAGYFAVKTVFKSAPDKSISELKELMVSGKYSELLERIDKLPSKIRQDTVVSELSRKAGIMLARDSITTLTESGWFLTAVRFYENLREEIRADSSLVSSYENSRLLMAKDSLNKLISAKNINEGKILYRGLENQFKENQDIRSLYGTLLSLIAVDSLISEGTSLFEKKDYKQSEAVFNLVIRRYDRDNQYADSMIKVINSLNRENRPVTEVIATPEGCLKIYSGRTLRFDSAPDTRTIRLLSNCLTESEMIITLEIQPLDYGITISRPGSESSFYIEYNYGSGTRSIRLRDIPPPVRTDVSLNIKIPMRLVLVFPRLPDDIAKFDLLEGKNQRELNREYWNFKGINL